MFENLPATLGKALGGVRAGTGHLLLREAAESAPQTITVRSSAFRDGGEMPVRFTADGEGLSPPLAWSGLPPATREVVLVVEDPDAPAPRPLIHLIAVLAVGVTAVEEGELMAGSWARLGKHSLGGVGWLASDPPPGHGPHHYLFQVFALDRAIAWDEHPSKDEVKAALKTAVIAKGLLTGVYERPGRSR